MPVSVLPVAESQVAALSPVASRPELRSRRQSVSLEASPSASPVQVSRLFAQIRKYVRRSRGLSRTQYCPAREVAAG